MKTIRILWLIILFICPSLGWAQAVKSAHTEVELISEYGSIKPGQPFPVALKMTLEEGWHVYWVNPGDSGIPPQVEWTLPEGLNAGDFQWPLPHRIEAQDLTDYGYDGQVILIADILTSPGIPKGSVSLKAHVSWLACEKICVPGQAQLSLNTNVSDQEPIFSSRSKDFALARKHLPQSEKNWQVKSYAGESDIQLYITASPQDLSAISQLEFYPLRNDIIVHSRQPRWTRSKSGITMVIPRSDIFRGSIDKLEGLLVITDHNNQRRGIDLDLREFLNSPMTEHEVTPAKKDIDQSRMTVWLAFLFAFIGGVILNLMPCVLPVLSIKVLSLVEQSHERKNALIHGFLYTLGVLTAFWALALILIILKALGHEIGWGFQFQSPSFVAAIALLFYVMVLNFFGVFELNIPGLTIPKILPMSSKYIGAYLSGILATIVATPCTAPFMGTAIGFAVSQDSFVTLLIFSGLGLGLAFPFLLLVAFPGFLRFIPKPGRWMIYFKKILGAVLLTAVIWLAWVLGLQAGNNAAMSLVIAFILITISFLIWQKNRALSMLRMSERIVKGIAAAIMIFAITFPFIQIQSQQSSTQKLLKEDNVESTTSGIVWQKYNPDLIEQLRRENKPVFLNFTAAWCLSCQVNERVVFTDKRVIGKFKSSGIVAVKADWTTWDNTVTQALAEFGKNSIPLYVFYPQGQQRSPVILPEIITPHIVLNVIKNTD